MLFCHKDSERREQRQIYLAMPSRILSSTASQRSERREQRQIYLAMPSRILFLSAGRRFPEGRTFAGIVKGMKQRAVCVAVFGLRPQRRLMPDAPCIRSSFALLIFNALGKLLNNTLPKYQ